jgi:hypothetical protein
MALPRTLAFLALSALSLADARAHTVEGWYAGAAIGLIGASGTKEDACLMAWEEFRGEQIRSGVGVPALIATLNSVDGTTCVWNNNGGATGSYGGLVWLPSDFYPPPPFGSPPNLGGCPCPEVDCRCPSTDCPCPEVDCPCPTEGNPITPATGNKFQREPDFAGKGPHALKFVRYYNSAAGNVAVFSAHVRTVQMGLAIPQTIRRPAKLCGHDDLHHGRSEGQLVDWSTFVSARISRIRSDLRSHYHSGSFAQREGARHHWLDAIPDCVLGADVLRDGENAITELAVEWINSVLRATVFNRGLHGSSIYSLRCGGATVSAAMRILALGLFLTGAAHAANNSAFVSQ